MRSLHPGQVLARSHVLPGPGRLLLLGSVGCLLEDRICALSSAFSPRDSGTRMKSLAVAERDTKPKKPARAVLVSSGFLAGSRNVPPEEVDRAFGMPIGKLRKRAGI